MLTINTKLQPILKWSATALTISSYFIFHSTIVYAFAPRRPLDNIVLSTSNGLDFLQIYYTVSLFVLLPATLISIIYQIITSKRNGANISESLHITVVGLTFIKYFAYYASLFGIWLVVLYQLNSKYHALALLRNGSIVETSLVLMQKHYVLFLLYIEFWAIVGPYLQYWWNLRRKQPAVKPTIELVLLLTIVNGLIFLTGSLLLHRIFLLA